MCHNPQTIIPMESPSVTLTNANNRSREAEITTCRSVSRAIAKWWTTGAAPAWKASLCKSEWSRKGDSLTWHPRVIDSERGRSDSLQARQLLGPCPPKREANNFSLELTGLLLNENNSPPLNSSGFLKCKFHSNRSKGLIWKRNFQGWGCQAQWGRVVSLRNTESHHHFLYYDSPVIIT